MHALRISHTTHTHMHSHTCARSDNTCVQTFRRLKGAPMVSSVLNESRLQEFSTFLGVAV